MSMAFVSEFSNAKGYSGSRKVARSVEESGKQVTSESPSNRSAAVSRNCSFASVAPSPVHPASLCQYQQSGSSCFFHFCSSCIVLNKLTLLGLGLQGMD